MTKKTRKKLLEDPEKELTLFIDKMNAQLKALKEINTRLEETVEEKKKTIDKSKS
jgi:hypothetical protein